MSAVQRFTGLGVAIAVSLVCVGATQASPMRSVVIGRIASEKTCTVYQESAGRSSLVATRHMLAESESWRTWLVKDCVTNFANIRTSLEAALASTGKFTVKTAGAGYTVTGVIGQVGGDDGPIPTGPSAGGGYSIASRQMFVSMDVMVRDPAGHMIYGGLLTKHLETASNIQTQGLQTSSSQSGQDVYDELQHEVALAVARLVAFHIDPLRVTNVEGRRIQLNYGSPLLTLGTIVEVAGQGAAPATRYYVTSSSPDGATAEVHGEIGDWTKVGPGSVGTVIESDDSAAGARTTNRVELPE